MQARLPSFWTEGGLLVVVGGDVLLRDVGGLGLSLGLFSLGSVAAAGLAWPGLAWPDDIPPRATDPSSRPPPPSH